MTDKLIPTEYGSIDEFRIIDTDTGFESKGVLALPDKWRPTLREFDDLYSQDIKPTEPGS
jgi:hypothetical protein